MDDFPWLTTIGLVPLAGAALVALLRDGAIPQPGPQAYGSDVSAALQPDGAPLVAWAGEAGTFIHKGIDPAIPYAEVAATLHVLSACVVFSDGTYRRLFYGDDYTDTTGGFTLTDPARGNGYTADANNKTDSILCQLFGLGCPTPTRSCSPCIGAGWTMSWSRPGRCHGKRCSRARCR